MKTFNYFFGVNLGILLFGYVDNLATALQGVEKSAMEGQELAKMTVGTLRGLRSDAGFETLWGLIERRRASLNVEDPVLPRKRKVPARFEEGKAAPEFVASVEAHYRIQYFEVIDYLVNGIESRFDQRGYKTYSNLEHLLVKAVRTEILPYQDKDFKKTLDNV